MSCGRWKVIIDNLMTQDKVTFRDLLSRLHYSSVTGVNLFSSPEQVGWSISKYYQCIFENYLYTICIHVCIWLRRW